MYIKSDLRQCVEHSYIVICRRCGGNQTNNDDGVDVNIKKVETDDCNKCCPTAAGIPNQFFYDKNNQRVYSS